MPTHAATLMQFAVPLQRVGVGGVGADGAGVGLLPRGVGRDGAVGGPAGAARRRRGGRRRRVPAPGLRVQGQRKVEEGMERGISCGFITRIA